jgi:hypothetical protein
MSQTLPSRYTFGDTVNVKLDSVTPAIQGEVVGISFSESTVFYDVQTEYELLIRISSSLVGMTETVTEEEIG